MDCLIISFMNTQFFTRVTQIKQYIGNLKDSLVAKDHQSACVIVSKFKNIILKQDAEQYAYQCILDSLQTKNQKLQHQLQKYKEEKIQFQQNLQKNKNKSKLIKETKIQFMLSRLGVGLGDCKKIQFKDGTIYSDYNNIYLNSAANAKYQNYPISVKQLESSQTKINFMHLSWGKDEKTNLILKFNNEKDAQKWSICLKFAELITKNKNESNLFQAKQEEKKKDENNKVALTNNNQIATNNNNILTNSHANHSHQMSSLNLNAVFNYHKNSPSESMISDRKSHQKAGQQKDKDTERSLVQAMEHNSFSNVVSTRFGTNRLEIKKPAKLNKIRGLSDSLDSNFELSRTYKNYPRKQSEDIFKPQINQLYHQKMLQKLKFRDRQDSIKSQTQQVKKSDQKGQSIDKQIEKSTKLQSLQKKKKEILNQIQSLPSQKQEKPPAFLFDAKVNWTGIHIQQMEEEQKSKSSNRDSRMSSIANDQGHGKKKQYDGNNSQKISQRSLQQSPRLPMTSSKYGNVPKKVSYNDGYVFNLVQVEKSPEKNQNSKSPFSKFKQEVIDDNQQIPQAQSKVLTSSQSGSDQHSHPSTHQNHTESEDNNGRAQELKKGIVVTKCSQNGFWTHEKILHLSENESELCSRDLKDKKIKKIKLSNIQGVQYKAYYKGIIKHVSKIQDDKCLVIQALAEDNKIKNYEYVGNLAQPLQRFATSLKLFVDYYMKQ